MISTDQLTDACSVRAVHCGMHVTTAPDTMSCNLLHTVVLAVSACVRYSEHTRLIVDVTEPPGT